MKRPAAWVFVVYAVIVAGIFAAGFGTGRGFDRSDIKERLDSLERNRDVTTDRLLSIEGMLGTSAQIADTNNERLDSLESKLSELQSEMMPRLDNALVVLERIEALVVNREQQQ